MADINLRARTTSEIVDAAFALYRRNVAQYTTVTAIAYSPILVLNFVMQGGRTTTTPADFLRVLPVTLLSIVVFTLVGGVVMRMGSDVYLGQEPDVGRTISAILPRVPSLLIAAILVSIVAFFSALLLLLPVFYVLARFFAITPIIALENKGPFEAITRSGVLSKGIKWHILLTLLLAWGIYLIVSAGISLITAALHNVILTLLVASLFSVFAFPIVTLVTMVLYYDARIRIEGFDVEHMSRL